MKRSTLLQAICLALIPLVCYAVYSWKPITPLSRNAGRMIIDSLNQRAILFGGGSYWSSGHWYNDVWEIPLNDSTRFYWLPVLASGVPPTPRGDHIIAYDPTMQRMIMFSGDTLWSTRANDIWALDLTLGAESWHRIYPTGTPPLERSAGGGIYHPGRNSFIIFGGGGNTGQTFDDVWELQLDSLQWMEIPISGIKPDARGGHATFYDPVNDRLIIFGGCYYNTGQFYNDLWALDLTVGSENWTQLITTGNIPNPRACFVYGYDPIPNKLYVSGGLSYSGILESDVYVLDIATLSWTQQFPTGEQPAPRRNAAGAFDFFNKNLLIFGGDYGSGSYYGDAFILDVDVVAIHEWQQFSQVAEPKVLISSPAAGSVRIRYILSQKTNMTVSIIDISGRLVRTLFKGIAQSSTGWLCWDGKDSRGRNTGAGVFYCRLQTETESITRKFVIAK